MNRIYIVEGLDRTGKSSLIDKLRSKIKNPKIAMIHSSKPPKDVDQLVWADQYYTNLILTAIQLHAQGFDVILDRAWLGEYVYGTLYRGLYTSCKERIVESFEYIIKDPSVFKLVLLVDSPEALLARDDGLSFSSDLVSIKEERELFISAFNCSRIANKVMIDWQHHDFNTTLNKLVEQLTNDV